MIERSRIDNRWCVYTRHRETLCPWWAVPLVMIFTIIAYPSDRKAARRWQTFRNIP